MFVIRSHRLAVGKWGWSPSVSERYGGKVPFDERYTPIDIHKDLEDDYVLNG